MSARRCQSVGGGRSAARLGGDLVQTRPKKEVFCSDTFCMQLCRGAQRQYCSVPTMRCSDRNLYTHHNRSRKPCCLAPLVCHIPPRPRARIFYPCPPPVVAGATTHHTTPHLCRTYVGLALAASRDGWAPQYMPARRASCWASWEASSSEEPPRCERCDRCAGTREACC